jgi:hypothetical protein
MKNLLIVLLAFISFNINAQYVDSDREFIEKTFFEIEQIVKSDNGQLWGINLNLPIMTIDQNTKEIIANKPDKQNLLKKKGNYYVGYYPKDKPIANSITEFGGTMYAYVGYPFPFPKTYLKAQLIHEMFHLVQDTLNLKTPEYNNQHMTAVDSRIFLQLEWNALEKALTSQNPEEKKEHIRYALKFRKKRRLLFEDAAKNENYFEIQEGLPEYTGHILASSSPEDYIKSIEIIKNVIKPLEDYSGSFAYYSGCLYGRLLYYYDKNWGKTFQVSDNFGEKLQEYSGISKIDTVVNIDFINTNYNAYNIRKKELKKEQEKEQIINNLKRIFNDTILSVNLVNTNMKVYPTATKTYLDTKGTVNQKIEIFDEWGKLIVTDGGCLINDKQTSASVPARNIKVEGKVISTENWKLFLNNEWSLKIIDDKYILQKK